MSSVQPLLLLVTSYMYHVYMQDEVQGTLVYLESGMVFY